MIVGYITMKIKHVWSIKEQATLLKRLSTLLEKGYTLNEALNFLYVNEKGKKKDDLNICLSQLTAGYSLRKAFTILRFHRDVLSYLYFAEEHGDLEFALKEGSEILHKKITHLDQLFKILRYPIFLIITVFVILGFVQSVITPQFEQLYSSMNIESSFFSQFLLLIFSSLRWLATFVFMSFIVLVIYYFTSYKKKSSEEKMNIILKIPILKSFFVMIFSYFFALQLSNLLRGGMSIFESLKTFEKQRIMPFYQVEAKILIQKLKAGTGLHQIIYERDFYEKELSQVILHGQANGQLARELYMYSQFVIERLESKLNRITMVIQPTIYGFVGIIVLFVYLSMLLPMYKMMESI